MHDAFGFADPSDCGGQIFGKSLSSFLNKDISGELEEDEEEEEV